MSWINVKDEPPPAYKKVMLYSPRHGIFILSLSQDSIDNGLSFAGYDTGPFVERITHWMPLPKEPE